MLTKSEWVEAARTACVAILASLWTPARAEADKLTGTVEDRVGKPAAGAKVWIAKLDSVGPLDARESTSDASGRFSIEANPGVWSVFAVRGNEGGRVGWDLIPHVESGKNPAPVSIRLGPPTILRGLLVDAATGKPIAAGSTLR